MILTYTEKMTADEYNELRLSVDWKPLTPGQAERGLANTTFLVAARDGEKIVGMGRMLFGIAVGSALGSAKDKEMSEKMMEISRIEEIPDSSDKLIYAIGKNEEEKEFRVDEKCFASEKFVVGDRVAEETDGKLVSLETK